MITHALPPAVVQQIEDADLRVNGEMKNVGYPRYCRRAVIAELRRAALAGGTRASVRRTVEDLGWQWSRLFDWSPMLASVMVNPYRYAVVSTDYQIARSLRFNKGDAPYLSKTFAGAGTSNKIATLSFWVKLTDWSVEASILGAASPLSGIRFSPSGQTAGTLEFFIFSGSYTVRFVTTPLYRDPTAWMHVIIAIDTTQASSSNGFKMWINGVQVTAFSTSTYTQNATFGINQNTANYWGSYGGGIQDHPNCYLADIRSIDGQQKVATDFGEFDTTTGVWTPKTYSGTYGTNGYWLSVYDNTSTTTIGYDDAGGVAGSGAGSNDWNSNNFSVTAGAGNDSLTDTPTNYGADTGAGGEVRANYAVLNPLDKGSGVTLSDGNLRISNSSDTAVRSTLPFPKTGKWGFEFKRTSGVCHVGIALGSASLAEAAGTTGSYTYNSNDGQKLINNSSAAYGASWTSTDTITVLFDADTGDLTFHKNGVSQGSAATLTTGLDYFPTGGRNTMVGYFNFGQRPFDYALPAGYKALCTQNFATPVIVKPTEAFDINLRTGTGSAGSVSGKLFQPSLIISKSRSTRSGLLADDVRGTGKYASPDQATTEVTDAQSVTAFNSDGFSFGTAAILNTNAENFVDILWKKGVTQGLDIISYAGNGSNRTISHNLGVAPGLVLVRGYGTLNWAVWHKAFSGTEYIRFGTGAKASSTTFWNSTVPSSSVVSLGTETDVNWGSSSYSMYVFAEVAGYSRFASYVGNGNADGPFVWCGFRPKFVLIKRYDGGTEHFQWLDSAREVSNPRDDVMFLSNTTGETNTVPIDFLSNGFKIRTTDSRFNTSTGTYLVIAFAEAPSKYARAA